MEEEEEDDLSTPSSREPEWDDDEPECDVAFAACLRCRSLVVAVTPDGLPMALLDPPPTIRLRFWSELTKSVEPYFAGLDFAPGRRGFHDCG